MQKTSAPDRTVWLRTKAIKNVYEEVNLGEKTYINKAFQFYFKP